MKKILILSLFGLVLLGCQANVDTNEPKKEQPKQEEKIINNEEQIMSHDEIKEVTKAVMKTSMGDITIELYAKDSPKTVANFTKLAASGFYDGTKFHRVIKDFMIQAGDPLSKDDTAKNRWGTGGPGYEFEDEFNSHKLVKGSFAMANAGPDTNGSQFFIVTAEATPWLDGKHTNFGRVTQGMDIVEKIENATTEAADRPIEDVVINSIEL